jgi:hypothetical protein
MRIDFAVVTTKSCIQSPGAFYAAFSVISNLIQNGSNLIILASNLIRTSFWLGGQNRQAVPNTPQGRLSYRDIFATVPRWFQGQ